jgi:hypothetical protein
MYFLWMHRSPALKPEYIGNILMEILFKEYCLELYAENGSDWLASRRIQKNGQPWFKAMKPDVDNDQFDENFWCWPIPATEITLNTAMIQNPGNFNE